MKTKTLFALFFAGSLAFTSCSGGNEDKPAEEVEVTEEVEATPSIVELAQATEDLSILVEAVVHANLVDALSAEGPFTVFAPTNAAFEKTLEALGVASVTDIPSEDLAQILLYHVVQGKVMSTDLSNTYVNTLNTQAPNGANVSLQVQTTDGVKFGGVAAPVAVDVEASNGVVHIIDEVMMPKNIVELALGNANFSTLVAALGATKVDYVGTLSGDGPFTVFAPTNEAFGALLDSNEDWNELTDIPTAVVDAVLQYHVVNGANVQSGDLSAGDVKTFGGASITINLDGSPKIETTSGQTVNIMVTDVQGTNGVIHAIDAVLLPKQ